MKKTNIKLFSLVLSAGIIASGYDLHMFDKNTDKNSSVYAVEESVIPTSFYGAVAFDRDYGKSLVIGDRIIFVLKEQKNVPERNYIEYSEEKSLISTETYEGNGSITAYGNQNNIYTVFIFKPESENFVINLSNEHEYTYRKQADGTFIETDYYSWVPDSITEYNEYKEKYPNGYFEGDFAAFCVDLNASMGETIYVNQTGETKLQNEAEIIIENPEEKFSSGGSLNNVYVFKAEGKGKVNVTLSVLDIFESVVNKQTSECVFGAVAEEQVTTETQTNEETTIPQTDVTEMISDTSSSNDESVFYECGDIDLNGVVELTDLTYLSLYLLKQYEFNDNQMILADITGDGQVDIADLATLKQVVCNDPDVVINGHGIEI